jgi:hypothetical protein
MNARSEKTVGGFVDISRGQVPITIAFCITDYKSQGKTWDKAEIDICKQHATSHNQWTSVNVQLGRLRSLHGVWLREEITIDDLNCKPDRALASEFIRLEALEQDTLSRWGAN